MADSPDDGSRSDGFLSRWSRRKQDVRAGVPVAEAPPPDIAIAAASAPALNALDLKPNQPLAQQNIAQAASNIVANDNTIEQADAVPAAPTLDDAKALTPQSDFAPFMARNVSPEVKNAAMKKLFTDPHYNVMDMMDVYVDDYSKSEPIPESMLKEMVSVKFLKLFERDEEDEAKTDIEAKVLPANQAVPQGTETALPRDDADTLAAQNVAQLPPSASLETPSLITHDNPDLRLQPNHAAERKSVGHSAG